MLCLFSPAPLRNGKDVERFSYVRLLTRRRVRSDASRLAHIYKNVIVDGAALCDIDDTCDLFGAAGSWETAFIYYPHRASAVSYIPDVNVVGFYIVD